MKIRASSDFKITKTKKIDFSETKTETKTEKKWKLKLKPKWLHKNYIKTKTKMIYNRPTLMIEAFLNFPLFQ